MRFDGILICTDLDGTLLRKDKTISQENLDAIKRFKAGGGYFTTVTGRMPYTSFDICAEFSPNAPIGCINGGGVYDLEKRAYTKVRELSKTAYELVYLIEREIPDIGVQVNTRDVIYFARNNEAMAEFRRRTGAPNIERSCADIEEPVCKIIFAHTDEEKISRVKELLKTHERYSEFDYIRSEKMLYEILPKGCNKGSAVLDIADHLGVPRSRTVAIGDYDNDAPMLKAAAVGIAVANASAAAKAAADLVTVSNEEHAIARVIFDIESGEITFK